MEQLTEKIDISVKCPYCNEQTDTIIYLNADTCICNNCDYEFNIEIWVSDIKIIATKL